MKTIAWIFAIITLTISACTSQKQATSYVNDDVYSSPSRQEQVQTSPTQPASQGAQVVTAPDKSAAQKPASSTLEEDYNDYSYANRINRFSSKDTTVGYFDDSHPGSASGGTQWDNSPDVNIYMGNGGYFGPSYSFGMGWGNPYYNWGWDYGWGYPYYGGYYGFGYPYSYGWYNPWYNPWYNSCCYCYGYNEWYPHYNTYDTYYGSRKSLYRSDRTAGTTNDRNTAPVATSGLKLNDRSTSTPAYTRTGTQPSSVQTGTPTARTTQSTVRTVPTGQEKYRYTRPTTERQTINSRSTKQRTVQNRDQAVRQQPNPRYTRPENSNAVQRTQPAQSYSSPVYRQPKSSQEYLAPRSQNPGATRTTTQNSDVRSGSGSTNTGIRQSGSSTNHNRTYTTPTRSGSSGYSTPSRTNYNTVSPTRSGSGGSNTAPTRSGGGGSYSPPSNTNSGGSYSTPSRSSGGSGGSSSGGSGNSGGGKRR